MTEEAGLEAAGSSTVQNLEQNVLRTDWDCKSRPHEEVGIMPTLLEDSGRAARAPLI
jgi:hypothetical protein